MIQAHEPKTMAPQVDRIVDLIHTKTTVPISKEVLRNWANNIALELLEEHGVIEESELRARLLDHLCSGDVLEISRLINKVGSNKVLRAMDSKNRRTFLLTYMEGLSDQEAAECCSCGIWEYRRYRAELVIKLEEALAS